MNEKFTAYHEAGHCVACLSMGYKFNGVTIDPNLISMFNQPQNKEVKGIILLLKNGFGDNFLDMVVYDYAGPFAEAKYRKCTPELIEGGDMDFEHAQQMFDKWVENKYGISPEKLRRELVKRTRHYLNEHWDWVQAIAEALLDRKSLTYEDAAKIAANVSKIERIETREDLDRELQQIEGEVDLFEKEGDFRVAHRG